MYIIWAYIAFYFVNFNCQNKCSFAVDKVMIKESYYYYYYYYTVLSASLSVNVSLEVYRQ